MLTVELPDEVVAALGSEERAADRAREALVLDLLREGQLGQSRAAELLGITRWDLLDLMGRYGVRQGPLSGPEMEQDAANAMRAAAHSEQPHPPAGHSRA
jgi:predicted HTH domain antitoxin